MQPEVKQQPEGHHPALMAHERLSPDSWQPDRSGAQNALQVLWQPPILTRDWTVVWDIDQNVLRMAACQVLRQACMERLWAVPALCRHPGAGILHLPEEDVTTLA